MIKIKLSFNFHYIYIVCVCMIDLYIRTMETCFEALDSNERIMRDNEGFELLDEDLR